jgi:lipoprotein LprG
MKRQPTTWVASVTIAIALLSGCSGQGSDVDADALLKSAAEKLAKTSGVELELTGSLPKGVSGLTKAEGTATSAPAFEGTISVIYSSLPVTVDIIAVGGQVFAVLPYTTEFAPIDPAEYGAPDPAILMDRSEGIPTWLDALTEAEVSAEEVRDGSEVLTEVSGSIPGEVVASVIPSAAQAADFVLEARINSDGEMTSLTVTGPFYPDASDVTYVVAITGYDVDKNILAP